MEIMYEELKKVRKSRERLFDHCINLLAVLLLEIRDEKDPIKRKYNQNIYDLTFQAIKIDEQEICSLKVLKVKG